MLIVNAPNVFVMAAEQDEPKNPVVEKSAMVSTFPNIDHVGSNPSFISCNVPGRVKYAAPSRKSPFIAAAINIKNVAILYNLKMNSSCPTSYWFMSASLRLLMAPSHNSEIVNMMMPNGWKTADDLESACMNMPNPATINPTMP